MSLLVEIQNYLAGIGSLGLTAQTNFFASYLPDTPDQCVTIYEYAGPGPQDTMGSQSGRAAWWKPRLQVVCRDANYLSARNLAGSISVALHQVVNQTIGGTLYYRIAAQQDPFLRARDQRERSEIVCNYQVEKMFS